MTGTRITIRPATLDDLTTIVAFNQAMAQETEDKPLDDATISAGVKRALSDSGLCTYFMAEIDGAVVGQTMITHEWSDWRNGLFWWIQSVYVSADYRRLGVFRSLYDHIRDLAKSTSGVCGLRLYVINTNTRAIETYRNLGMTVSDYRLCEEEWPT